MNKTGSIKNSTIKNFQYLYKSHRMSPSLTLKSPEMKLESYNQIKPKLFERTLPNQKPPLISLNKKITIPELIQNVDNLEPKSIYDKHNISNTISEEDSQYSERSKLNKQLCILEKEIEDMSVHNKTNHILEQPIITKANTVRNSRNTSTTNLPFNSYLGGNLNVPKYEYITLTPIKNSSFIKNRFSQSTNSLLDKPQDSKSTKSFFGIKNSLNENLKINSQHESPSIQHKLIFKRKQTGAVQNKLKGETLNTPNGNNNVINKDIVPKLKNLKANLQSKNEFSNKIILNNNNNSLNKNEEYMNSNKQKNLQQSNENRLEQRLKQFCKYRLLI